MIGRGYSAFPAIFIRPRFKKLCVAFRAISSWRSWTISGAPIVARGRGGGVDLAGLAVWEFFSPSPLLHPRWLCDHLLSLWLG